MTTQIVECNALPALILMLKSEDAAIHYEAVYLPLHLNPVVFSVAGCGLPYFLHFY